MKNKTQTVDSVEYEVIETEQAEILGELFFEYANDEEITKPESASQTKLFIGNLDGEIVFRSLDKNTGKISGDLIIEKQNLLFVAESIEKLFGKETPWTENIEYRNGKDDLLIYFQSSWAHNLPAPFERIVIRNRRKYLLDGLRSHLLGLELPLHTAEKLIVEIKKLSS
jgi:hypothetical protein